MDKEFQLFLERCNEETASISYEVKDASHKLKIEGFPALIFYGICEILTTMSKKEHPDDVEGQTHYVKVVYETVLEELKMDQHSGNCGDPDNKK
ncbi:MAG: hypothetical protein ACLT46_09515 [Hungatella sp.]